MGIITLIVNNGAMVGYEKNIPIATERYGAEHATGKYAAMAASLGAHAEHVTDPNEVGSAIERAKEISATGRPALRPGNHHPRRAGVLAVLPLIAMPPCYPVGARLCYEHHHHNR